MLIQFLLLVILPCPFIMNIKYIAYKYIDGKEIRCIEQIKKRDLLSIQSLIRSKFKLWEVLYGIKLYNRYNKEETYSSQASNSI